MRNALRKGFRAIDFFLEPGVWRYWRQARSSSIASYRLCQAVAAYQSEMGAILDVGANQGQFATAAAYWFPRAKILSFEPVPATVALLRRNTAHLSGLEVLPVALGAIPGKIRFFSNKYSHASSALPIHSNQTILHPDTASVEEIEVAVDTLDRVMGSRSVEHPLLLKLDVQGFEREVLQGGRKTLAQADYLLFETSFVPFYEGEALFEEMHTIASDHGFVLLGPVGFLEDGRHRVVQLDLLYRRR
jgi:FkbM family methyltransferase